MKKIPSLFQRDFGSRLVCDEVTRGCEWVINGEGVATRKWDGTCCLIRDGKLFKRRVVEGERLWTAYQKLINGSSDRWGFTLPENFELEEIDQRTGKAFGWLPVGESDKWHREAFGDRDETSPPLVDGTYELCGPKINGNPEGFGSYILIRHGGITFPRAPRTFERLREYLSLGQMEGLVWHHPDGRMAKIKARDFGFQRL